MKRRAHVGLSRLLIAFLTTAAALLAQMDTGNITVTVKDASGSAVPGATVTLHNERTGATTRTAVTNELGSYTFPLIPSGSYSLRVEQRGFKAYERSGIYLQVNEHLSIPLSLEVGEVSEQVSVTAMAPLVEATSG